MAKAVCNAAALPAAALHSGLSASMEKHGSPRQSVADWLRETEVSAPGFTQALNGLGIRHVGQLVEAVTG